jgi:uracil phosphoribosyltransferase/phosphoserine phosphatase
VQKYDHGPKIPVIAGHFMFWNEKQDPVTAWTEADAKMYTHIIYYDVPSNIIAQRRAGDKTRSREPCSVSHLDQWKESEMKQLREVCAKKGILFSVVSCELHEPALLAKSRIRSQIINFHHHSEEKNWRRIEQRIDGLVADRDGSLDKVLVFDADKTLTTSDTGVMFWNAFDAGRGIQPHDRICPLKALFRGPLKYTYKAFHQVSILFGQPGAEEYEVLCEEVALAVSVHPELREFIRKATSKPYIMAIIVTCGQQLIWDKIVEKVGLADRIKVIGAGRASDPSALVVDANIKANIVKRLKAKHGLHVVALGDSPLDVPMMEAANEAIVVVGPEDSRNVSMETVLENAITSSSLTAARQVILPRGSRCRLSPHVLPIISLDEELRLRCMLAHRPAFTATQTTKVVPHAIAKVPPHARGPVPAGVLPFKHATNTPMAKLLMAPMRNASIQGRDLREAHHQVGRHLSIEFLSELLGLEKYLMPHVQGGQTEAHRLRNESTTGIIALMRGGEPMALGVSDAFPTAALIHAKEPGDLRPEQIKPLKAVILVDSVINSGKSITEMVRRIRSLAPGGIRIAVLAGVVQAKAVSEGPYALDKLDGGGGLCLAALRVSDNKYTGKGGTDTGNRLFNTTYLE